LCEPTSLAPSSYERYELGCFRFPQKLPRGHLWVVELNSARIPFLDAEILDAEFLEDAF
jgi:hypothetical protein